MSNSCKCMESMGKPYGGSGSAITYVQGFLHACSHSLIPRLPLSGTQICVHRECSAWYLFSCEHNIIKIGPQFLEQKTAFCVLFNQLSVQCSVHVYDIRLPIARYVYSTCKLPATLISFSCSESLGMPTHN